MNRALIYGLCLAVFSASCATTEPEENAPKKAGIEIIPIDTAWAYQMQDLKPDGPQPKDIRELEPESFGKSIEGLSNFESHRRLLSTRISQINRAISSMREAREGFAVYGTGETALREVHNVLVAGERPEKTLAAGEPLSIFFYTRGIGTYVRLQGIEKEPGKIIVRYRFVPKLTADAPKHYALIPIGPLGPGKVSVSFVASPLEQKFADQGFAPLDADTIRRNISKSFEFSVTEQKREE